MFGAIFKLYAQWSCTHIFGWLVFPNNHQVKLLYCPNDGVRYSGSHCLLHFLSHSYLIAQLVFFLSFPHAPSKLSFMPYEQVGEQNQKILYKHYMDTGKIKDCLLTKIWFHVLQWFFIYQSWKVLYEKNVDFDQKKIQGCKLFRQEFLGLLVIKETLAVYFVFCWIIFFSANKTWQNEQLFRSGLATLTKALVQTRNCQKA